MGLLAETEAHHAVVYVGCVVGVDVPVLPVVGRDGEAEGPALTVAPGGQGLHLLDIPCRVHPQEPARVALGKEGVATREEGDTPRHLEVRGDHAHPHLYLAGVRRPTPLLCGRRTFGGGVLLYRRLRRSGMRGLRTRRDARRDAVPRGPYPTAHVIVKGFRSRDDRGAMPGVQLGRGTVGKAIYEEDPGW